MSARRAGAFEIMGGPKDVIGNELKAGDQAPNFQALGIDLKPYGLENATGKVVIVASVPSLDTGVCDKETRRFNEAAAGLENTEILVVSNDLPFAQKRWCGAAGIDKVKTLSAHRDTDFGEKYGVLVDPIRLLQRAVFVVGKDGKVKHVEYLKKAGEEPNYDAALAAAKAAQ